MVEVAAAILSEADWTAAINGARDRASHFVAYELALKAIAAYPASLWFEHQAILALARAGALTGALDRYRRLEHDGRLEQLTGHLAGEFAGLGGRLFKDLAARSTGAAVLQNRLKSAETYRAGFLHLGQYYLAINAAAMYLAAGHPDLAARRVEQAREHLQDRGLAGAVRAEETDHLAAPDAHAHILDDPACLIVFTQMMNRKDPWGIGLRRDDTGPLRRLFRANSAFPAPLCRPGVLLRDILILGHHPIAIARRDRRLRPRAGARVRLRRAALAAHSGMRYRDAVHVDNWRAIVF